MRGEKQQKESDPEGISVVPSPEECQSKTSKVSGVHCATNSSETHSDLADLMAHDVAAARHYYKLNEKSTSSAKASRQLTQMCHAWRETTEGK